MNLKKKEKEQAATGKNWSLLRQPASLLRKIYLKAENLNTAVSLR